MKECQRSRIALLQKAFTATAAANVTTTGSVTLPKDRGAIKGIEIIIPSNTVADVDGCTLRAKINGIEIFDAVPFAKFTPLFESKSNIQPLPDTEGAEFEYELVNDQANAIVVYFIFHFADK